MARPGATSGLPIEAWNKFYASIYPRRIVDDTLFFGIIHPWLDKDISMEELIVAVSKCKMGKTPGDDEIATKLATIRTSVI